MAHLAPEGAFMADALTFEKLACEVVEGKGQHCKGDNRTDPPAGALGGGDGASGSFIRNPGTPEEEVLFSKVTQEVIHAGDRLEIRMPSGGGFGDPFLRDPFSVLSDVWDEYLTAEEARQDYGVVVNTDDWTVDAAATEQLRASRVAS